MGVCTNKVHKITLQVLEGLGISNFFGSVIGGDSLPTHKPDPAMMHACIKELGADDVVYVGDSEVDAATAVAAKIPFLLLVRAIEKAQWKPFHMMKCFQTFTTCRHFWPARLVSLV